MILCIPNGYQPKKNCCQPMAVFWQVFKKSLSCEYSRSGRKIYKDIKDMFTLTLDSIMNRLNLSDNTKSSSKNIFDILAEEINNTTTDKAS